MVELGVWQPLARWVEFLELGLSLELFRSVMGWAPPVREVSVLRLKEERARLAAHRVMRVFRAAQLLLKLCPRAVFRANPVASRAPNAWRSSTQVNPAATYRSRWWAELYVEVELSK